METLRVRCRGAALWFVLAGLAIVLTATMFAFGQDGARWVALGIGGCIAAALLAYAGFGAKRFIDFSDAVVVHHFFRTRTIPWNQVYFAECELSEAKSSTGIPFVSIPVQDYYLTLRLTEGRTFSASVVPEQIAGVMERVKAKSAWNAQLEQERRAKEATADAKSTRWLNFAGGLAACIGGVVFAVLMWDEIRYGNASAQWPTVTAKLTQSYVGSEQSSGGRRSSSEVTRFFPVVAYTYNLDGTAYEGNRFRFAPVKSQDQNVIGQLLAALPSGSDVQLRYNPADPAISVLVPGIGTERYVFFGVCVVAAAAGLGYSIFIGRGMLRG